MTHQKFARFYKVFLVGFLVVATVLSLGLTITTKTNISKNEKRKLTAMPEMPHTLEQWETFPVRFEAFFNDHFGFRKALLRVNAHVSSAILGKLPTVNAIQGQDGWLFYAGDHSLELFKNERSLSESHLENWKTELTRRQTWLAQQKIPYLFVIVPDKHTLYPEYMPAHTLRRQRPSQYDQIMALARTNNMPVLGLRDILAAEKAAGLIYLKTDTHWNDWGAYLGYRAVMDALNKEGQNLPVLALNRNQMPVRNAETGDLTLMANLSVIEQAPIADPQTYRCVFEIQNEPEVPDVSPNITRTRCNNASHKVLLFGDSFSVALIKYFAQSFGSVVTIRKDATFEEFKAYVNDVKPNYVIEEHVERYLQNIPDLTSK